jgi:hypothetical protein
VSSVLIFGIIFVAFFILRAIAATVFFYYMMPETNRCPMCDSPTLRVESRAWNRLMPWFRTSWCYECGWEGLLRPGGPLEPASTRSQSGQLPVSSKKSS